MCFGYKSYVRYVYYTWLLPACDLLNFLNAVFQRKILSFDKIHLVFFFFFSQLWFVLFVPYLRNLCLVQGHEDFLHSPPPAPAAKGFIVKAFVFRSMI